MKKLFNYHFEINRDTKLDSLIKIKGYYTMSWKGQKSNIIFFKDGTIGSGFRTEQDGFRTGAVIDAYMFGGYTIKNDTIKLVATSRGDLIVEYYVEEEWFKIIDSVTLELIYYKPLVTFSDTLYDARRFEETIKKYSFAEFVPTDTIPSSHCWIKKKKWAWKNKTDWKMYIKSIQTSKK